MRIYTVGKTSDFITSHEHFDLGDKFFPFINCGSKEIYVISGELNGIY